MGMSANQDLHILLNLREKLMTKLDLRRIQSELSMESDRCEPDRTSILVVAWVLDLLEVERGSDTFAHWKAVECLDDPLCGVTQRPITHKEIDTARRQVTTVCLREAIDRHSQCPLFVWM